MYKKSITRIENENDSSQADLSSPALHDIIATNHVVLAKNPREERLSRACKALIIMIILALVATGIIVLTLVLAHSRNTLMAIISRSAEENFSSTSNNSRFLLINQENLTTTSNEQTENENWQTTSTVILTGNNLHTFTTPTVHISSSSVMRTKQQYEEYISPTTQSQSMKPYPSSNTIVNEQSMIQTTVSNQQSTTTTSHHPTTMMTTENQLITTMKNEEQDIPFSSSDNHMTIQEETTSMPDETTFTTYINRHFNIQTSTKNEQKLANKYPKHIIDEDIMDDLLFS